ncbi:MAG: hypothetical protein ACOX60_05105 [Massiliimalia sp.]
MAQQKRKHAKKKNSHPYPGKTAAHAQTVELPKHLMEREDKFKWVKRIAAIVLTILLLFGMVILPVVMQVGYV